MNKNECIFKAYNIRRVCTCANDFKCVGPLVKQKNKYKVSVSFLENTHLPSNSKDCFESCIRVSVPAFVLCRWLISPSVHVLYCMSYPGFRNNFLDHRRPQSSIRKLEQASPGLQDGFLELASDFIYI